MIFPVFFFLSAQVRIVHAALGIHSPHAPSIIKKAPSGAIRRGFSVSSPHLIFQGIFTLLELAPASRMSRTGCCGFFGPVPPPLWISRFYYLTNPYFLFLYSFFRVKDLPCSVVLLSDGTRPHKDASGYPQNQNQLFGLRRSPSPRRKNGSWRDSRLGRFCSGKSDSASGILSGSHWA